MDQESANSLSITIASSIYDYVRHTPITLGLLDNKFF